MSDIDEKSKISRHSGVTYLSFSMYQITWTVIFAALNLTYYFYYNQVIGLEPIWIFVAMAIYTLWDSVNEPLIGYLIDRNFKFTKRWGRRFPWIVVFIIPWCLSLYLIYTPPNVDPDINPWPVFLWLIMSFIIFDTLITILDINVGTLRADKFRTESERRKYSKFFGPVDMIAQAVGMSIPPLFLLLSTGREAYAIMGALVALIAIISGILFIPGAREDKVVIDRYFSRDYEKISFFKGMKEVIKQKSFMAFYASYTLFLVATTLMTAMVLYVTTFILRVGEDFVTYFMALFLVGAIISVFIWHRYLKKINNKKKVYTIGGFVLGAALFPITFLTSNLVALFVLFFTTGMAMGCIWTLGVPAILSDVQDEYVVRIGKNQKGMLLGTWALISRFTGFFDELFILIVFTIVAFPPGAEDYQGLVDAGANIVAVQWGISFLLGIIPMCILLIGVFIFWKYYTLTPEKVLENKAKLKELGF